MSEEPRRTIKVTPSQVAAAKLLITCNERLGRETEPEIYMIAEARRVGTPSLPPDVAPPDWRIRDELRRRWRSRRSIFRVRRKD